MNKNTLSFHVDVCHIDQIMLNIMSFYMYVWFHNFSRLFHYKWYQSYANWRDIVPQIRVGEIQLFE